MSKDLDDKETDFFALIEGASDLDDLRNGRYIAFRRLPKNWRPSDIIRDLLAWAAEEGTPLAEATAGGVRLRNRAHLPTWARELRRMLLHLPRTDLTSRGSVIDRLVEPAIVYARCGLRRYFDRTNFSPLSSAVMRCFERQLRRTLSQTTKACFDLHFKAFETAYRCVKRRDDIFLSEIERAFLGEHPAHRLVVLFQSFPALARLWSQSISHWMRKIKEFSARLNEDKRAIRRTFFDGRNPGDLLGIEIDISDPHRGGRETMILRFQCGRVVYKPRSGQSESDWFSFIRWINRQGFTPPFRRLRMLLRRDYCWTEFIEYQPCRNEVEARRYHRCAGGLTCAAYLLGAIDCHRDNLIAARDQPVLIDTETLFHPQEYLTPPQNNGSVIRTGLLPLPKALLRSSDKISALGGTVAGTHTPTLKGELLATSKYLSDVLRGFRNMWLLIGEPRARTRTVFRRRVRRLREQQWRRIYCATQRYIEVRDRSLCPDALVSGIERSRIIAADLVRSGVSAPIILKEISALARLDVPYFVETPCARSGSAASLPLSDLLAQVHSAFVG